MAFTMSELEAIKTECHSMVTNRASLSAVSSAVPMPGVDIAADVAIMLELIPAINRKFGLSQEQIEGYSPATKHLIYQIIKKNGTALVGQTITKTLITQVMKKVAGRTAAKQALKFVPFIGSVANAAIGFGAMKYLGNSHINECFEVYKKILAKKG
ncbi:hypothetical protein CSQ88_13115 [Iodobacter sp. BJB302]|nr:hypothetical protein CSQ88_13115 [Iodobacter sp. BJB302]